MAGPQTADRRRCDGPLMIAASVRATRDNPSVDDAGLLRAGAQESADSLYAIASDAPIRACPTRVSARAPTWTDEMRASELAARHLPFAAVPVLETHAITPCLGGMLPRRLR